MAGVMGSKRARCGQNRLPPFVPLLIATLDSRAWKALSHGAKSLYVALRRRVPKGRNTAYLSYREATLELRSSRRKIAEWFRELEYYGFIVLARHGSLGVKGRGKSPHWRLTELTETSKASADGSLAPPTNNFLKWDGSPFQKRNPSSYAGTTVVPAGEPGAVPTGGTPKRPPGSYGVAIEQADSRSNGGAITRFTTMGAQTDLTSARSPQLDDAQRDGWPQLPDFLRRTG